MPMPRAANRSNSSSSFAGSVKPVHGCQEQFAACRAVHRHVAAHREEQAQRLGGVHPLHIDHTVAVRRRQVAGFSQRAGQLRQHGAACPRERRGAQGGQGQ
ncbi:hypothetical protein G6F59_017505 [Rhizopus arrhizus]|nr:hypothetical protein G6F59_017505 [Rhizopus arrhizus]